MNETDKENSAVSKGAKVIQMDFIAKQPNSILKQPPFDKPLPFFLSPNQIYSCILHDAKSFTTSYKSVIDPEIVYKEIKAVNGDNYVWLVARDWCEENYLKPSGIDFCYDVVLEIKIRDVYLYTDYGRYRNDYHDCMESHDWQQGEEAFIKMAALIGVKVSRGLVVEN